MYLEQGINYESNMALLRICNQNGAEPAVARRTQRNFTTTGVETTNQAREIRERMLKDRLERRERNGQRFERAVQEADGPIQLRGLLLADLARRENELCDLSGVDRVRHEDRMSELERFKKEIIEALRTLN